MKTYRLVLAAIALMLAGGTLPATAQTADADSVTFARDIAPILPAELSGLAIVAAAWPPCRW